MLLYKQHGAPPYYTFYIKQVKGVEIGTLKEHAAVIIWLPAYNTGSVFRMNTRTGVSSNGI
jgi:hypothetical protein